MHNPKNNFTEEEQEPFIAPEKEYDFAEFLHKFITPNITRTLSHGLSVIEKKATYPGRMSLQSERCSVIEVVLEAVAAYSSGRTDLAGVDMAQYYDNFIMALIEGTAEDQRYYALYTARIIKNFNLEQPLARMLFSPLNAGSSKGAAYSSKEEELLDRFRGEFNKLGHFSKDLRDAKQAVEEGDGHMNILLEGATEFKDDQLMTNYGNVLLRGNNILYIVMDASKH